jgi:hypothetical protein
MKVGGSEIGMPLLNAVALLRIGDRQRRVSPDDLSQEPRAFRRSMQHDQQSGRQVGGEAANQAAQRFQAAQGGPDDDDVTPTVHHPTTPQDRGRCSVSRCYSRARIRLPL